MTNDSKLEIGPPSPTDAPVFFSRCRPQSSDPIDLVLREGRVFIGWPAWRIGIVPQRGRLRDAIVDLRCPDEERAEFCSHCRSERSQYQKNRNFARSIKPGAIALVPRPNRGVVFAGRVVAPYELLNDPPWGDEYLSIRRQQGLDVEDPFSHLADVAQSCKIDSFRAVPLPLIPAWIRRSLLGRSTYGFVHPLPEVHLHPYPALDRLIESPERTNWSWTTDIAEVERRLINGVGPNAFENLCVALLQLDYPNQVWLHAGGSGDGGIDGIGTGVNGTIEGLLQCKWAYSGDEVPIAAPGIQASVQQILAALIHPDAVGVPPGVNFWSRHEIARRVIRYANRLPLAMSLRIGKRES
jgi:hypothetical protein